jgi:LysM repeat protein
MTKLIRSFMLSAILVFVLASCNLITSNPAQTLKTQATPALSPAGTIELIVQADTSVPFNSIDQIIKYRYAIMNKGTTGLPGTVSLTGATVTCPNVNTVGNLDAMLDVNETLLCTSSYPITQTDLDRGSVTSIVTANVNGVLSNAVTTTVPTVQNITLMLTKTANPMIYDRVGQTIIYSYTIKNNGSAVLGPAQFTVKDTSLGAPLNCGDANTRLDPNGTVTCSASYVVTQADMTAPSVTTSATAFGAGAGSSKPVSVAVTNSNITQTNPANLTSGSTIQHQVAVGEWLWQIARCYGANPNQVIQANPQLANPAQISPNTTVTVPNIGSWGKIYGPPCVILYTVQAGDTWNSIAENPKHNADVNLLRQVNPVTLTPGILIKVPRNSFGSGNYTTPIPSTSNAIRISFATGATSATVSGTALTGRGPIHYVLTASQGQTMTVKLSAPANSINMIIYAPNGSTLKPSDFTPTWSGTLPTTGDYRIDIVNALIMGMTDFPFTLEVSITGATANTGNCVDLTRNIKLAVSPTAPIHFNICGTMDASSRAKISTIHIYQRPEDVASGSLLQDIGVTVETSTPLGEANSLIVGDMNYDGNDDFRIVKNVPAGPNIPYLYYLFDPATRQFVYNAAYGSITSPEFPGNSQIVSKWRESAAKWGIDTYTIVTNNPILSQRELWEAISTTQARHSVTVFLANGTSQVVIDEVVPIP